MKHNAPLTDDEILKIGRSYGKVDTAQLAEELGISESRVERVATNLRKIGVEVSTFKNLGGIDRVAEILKKEQNNK